MAQPPVIDSLFVGALAESGQIKRCKNSDDQTTGMAPKNSILFRFLFTIQVPEPSVIANEKMLTQLELYFFIAKLFIMNLTSMNLTYEYQHNTACPDGITNNDSSPFTQEQLLLA